MPSCDRLVAARQGEDPLGHSCSGGLICWIGILAPAKRPPLIIAKLSGEAVRIMHMPEMKAVLAAEGAEPVGNSPEAFAAIIKADMAKWTKVVKAAGIKAE